MSVSVFNIDVDYVEEKAVVKENRRRYIHILVCLCRYKGMFYRLNKIARNVIICIIVTFLGILV